MVLALSASSLYDLSENLGSLLMLLIHDIHINIYSYILLELRLKVIMVMPIQLLIIIIVMDELIKKK
jgi:hypothetical protein